MAARFWVGGSGNWDAATTTHWASSTGGAGGASVPGPSDTVTFDANSGTAATVTVTAPASVSAVTINKSDLTLLCSSTLTVSGALTLTTGTLNTNGQTMTWGSFSSSGSSSRTLTLGASAISLTGTGTVWSLRFTTLTMTANTAVVTASGAAATISLSGAAVGGNYNGTSFVLTGSGTMAVTTAAGATTTVANLTRTGTAVRTDGLNFGGDLTITGTLTLTGNSIVNRMWVRSATSGTARTLTVNGSVVASNSDFTDITGAGSASWNLSAITGGSGDAQGNSGITFTTAATQTRTGAASTWSDATKWTSRVPLAQDDVIVASGASGTISMDVRFFGHNVDLTGFAGTISASGITTMYLWGNLTLDPGGGLGSTFGSTIVMAGRGSQTLTSNGRAISQGNNRDFTFGLGAGLGTVTLADDADIRLGSTGSVTLNSTLALNGKTLHGRSSSASAVGLSVVSGATLAGNGTLQWEGTFGLTTLYDIAAGASVTGTVNMTITCVSATAQTINGGGKSYGTLDYTVAGSTGSLTITGANTFQDIRFSDASNARSLILPSATITQILATHGLTGVVGTAGKLMTVKSSTGGSPATLALSNGYGGSSDYLSVQDITATSNTWYAGANSTNVSGNTNVTFTAAGSVVTGTLSAPLGGLGASAAAVPTVVATIAAPLGRLAASATAVPKINASLAAPLGGLTATATGSVAEPATLSAILGGLTAAASATPIRPATLDAPLGGLAAAAAATPQHAAALAAPLGALTASAAATITATVVAALTAPLGALGASAAAGVEQPAALAAPLGPLVATAAAGLEIPAALSAPLGVLLGTAVATPTVGASLVASLGQLSAHASAADIHPAALAAPLGPLAAAAAATRTEPASLAAPLGLLAAHITAVAVEPAVLYAALGALTAQVQAEVERAAVLDAPLGPLAAQAQTVVTRAAVFVAILGALHAHMTSTQSFFPPYRTDHDLDMRRYYSHHSQREYATDNRREYGRT